MIIISSKPGQLGNMLFLYSAFMANAMQHKYKVLNPAFEEYAKYFPRTNDDILCSYPSRKTLMSSEWLRKFLYYFFYCSARLADKIPFKIPVFETIHLDWEQSLNLNSHDFVNKAKNKILFVQGWLFRDEENCNKYSKEIKNILTPSVQHLENTTRIILKAKEKGEVIIGIHIRRGDYKTFEGGKYFYPLDDYKNLMKQSAALFQSKKTVFLICSNEKLNASDFNDFNYIFGTGKEIEDLYSFARCDYLIGPPSTYTMWASFYGDVPLYMIKNINTAFQLSDFKVKHA